MNNKGSGFMTGMIIGILALFMFLALTPSIVQMFGVSKGSNGANCPGYTDPNGLYSYNASLDTDNLSCTVVGFGPGLIILGVVFAVIIGIISGNLGQQQQQPSPYGYG